MIGCWLRPVKHPTLRNRHRTWGFSLAQKRLGLLPWCRRGSRPPGCALAISERWLPQPKALRSSVYSTFATLGHQHEDRTVKLVFRVLAARWFSPFASSYPSYSDSSLLTHQSRHMIYTARDGFGLGNPCLLFSCFQVTFES